MGNDANACTRSAPCRTIDAAVQKTSSGGEVRMLGAVVDEGDITIDRSITIDGGNLALINVPVVFPSWCILINAGVNDTITIRNISIGRSNNNGIDFLNGKQLNVENVKIQGVQQKGIDINLPAGTTSSVMIKDTAIMGIGSSQTAGTLGIRMDAASGTPTLLIDNSQIQRFATGLDVLRGKTTIRNSVVSNNSNFGIVAEGAAVLNVDNCVVSNNLGGVIAAGGSILRLSRNVIYDNTTSIVNGTGTVFSDGENRNSNPNGAVTILPLTRQ